MRIKRAIATAAIGGALALTGTGVAQAAPTQDAVAAAGLIAAAVNANDTVDITNIEILRNGEVLSNIDVDVTNNRILTGITVRTLNDNDIDITDVVDVTVVDNVIVVDVL